MGSGIAQVSAAAGYRTLLYDVNADAVEKARARLEKDLQTLVEKGKMTEEKKEAIRSRLVFTPEIDSCRADVIIEAVVENTEVKTRLFRQLAARNGEETIFATNTSSLSVSSLGRELSRPDRFAGLHFFNPAPLMKLVEVVQGEQTAPDVTDTLVGLVRSLGKEPVVCRDAPGFIVNRVARPFYIESLRVAEEGKVSLDAIDRLLESRGFRMGPFRLMDLIGNDVNYAVSCSVYEQLGRPERLKPSYLQKEKVESGQLGRKSGKGYYNYSG